MAYKSIKKQNVAVSLTNTRVGNVRYYTKDGKTYTRTVGSSASNPRSDAQMRVRSRIGNTVNMWRMLKPYLMDCFEAASKSVSEYNLFVKKAMNCTPVYLTKSQANTGACVAAPYGVSEGSLPMIQYALNSNGILQTNISLGNSFAIDANTTVGALAMAIVENNSAQYEYGDYLTFIAVSQLGDVEYPYVDVKAWNIELAKDSADKVLDKVNELGFSVAGGCLAMSEAPDGGCYAWIHSRKKSGVKVSGQYLYNGNEEFLANFISDEAFDDAKVTYGESKGTSFVVSDEGGEIIVTNKYTQTVSVAEGMESMGSVSGGGRYAEGSEITIHAVANSGYQFKGWKLNGGSSYESTEADYTYEVEADNTFVAEFEAEPAPSEDVTTTLTVTEALGGNVKIDDGEAGASATKTVAKGTQVTITATPNSDYRFNRWTGNIENNPYTLTVNEDKTLEAEFESTL